MGTMVLTLKNAAQYGTVDANPFMDSSDGIRGAAGSRSRHVARSWGMADRDAARRARVARRRVKRAERAAWRAEVADMLADEHATDPTDPRDRGALRDPWTAADFASNVADALAWHVDRATGDVPASGSDGSFSVRDADVSTLSASERAAFYRAAMLAGRTVALSHPSDGSTWTGALTAVYVSHPSDPDGPRALVSLVVSDRTFSLGAPAADIIGAADGRPHGITR